ncbi:MAG TPA: CsbD family protein [Gemmatimonadaceae bacterium]|nr:CsbD family protein [Gemmatimonadaceae bacterium]
MGEMNKKGAGNEAKGAIRETAGKIKGDVGDALDDSSMHAEGRGEQLKGKIQKNFGKAERALDPDTHRDSTDSDRKRRE